MTRDEAIGIILYSEGRFVGLEFTKRTTGEQRQMVCRTGVRKHLRGGPRAYDPIAKGLITVWDTQKQQYRSVPIEGITKVKVSGEWEDVN